MNISIYLKINKPVILLERVDYQYLGQRNLDKINNLKAVQKK